MLYSSWTIEVFDKKCYTMGYLRQSFSIMNETQSPTIKTVPPVHHERFPAIAEELESVPANPDEITGQIDVLRIAIADFWERVTEQEAEALQLDQINPYEDSDWLLHVREHPDVHDFLPVIARRLYLLGDSEAYMKVAEMYASFWVSRLGVSEDGSGQLIPTGSISYHELPGDSFSTAMQINQMTATPPEVAFGSGPVALAVVRRLAQVADYLEKNDNGELKDPAVSVESYFSRLGFSQVNPEIAALVALTAYHRLREEDGISAHAGIFLSKAFEQIPYLQVLFKYWEGYEIDGRDMTEVWDVIKEHNQNPILLFLMADHRSLVIARSQEEVLRDGSLVTIDMQKGAIQKLMADPRLHEQVKEMLLFRAVSNYSSRDRRGWISVSDVWESVVFQLHHLNELRMHPDVYRGHAVAPISDIGIARAFTGLMGPPVMQALREARKYGNQGRYILRQLAGMYTKYGGENGGGRMASVDELPPTNTMVKFLSELVENAARQRDKARALVQEKREEVEGLKRELKDLGRTSEAATAAIEHLCDVLSVDVAELVPAVQKIVDDGRMTTERLDDINGALKSLGVTVGEDLPVAVRQIVEDYALQAEQLKTLRAQMTSRVKPDAVSPDGPSFTPLHGLMLPEFPALDLEPESESQDEWIVPRNVVEATMTDGVREICNRVARQLCTYNMVAIFGPSGSGKSVIANTVAASAYTHATYFQATPGMDETTLVATMGAQDGGTVWNGSSIMEIAQKGGVIVVHDAHYLNPAGWAIITGIANAAKEGVGFEYMGQVYEISPMTRIILTENLGPDYSGDMVGAGRQIHTRTGAIELGCLPFEDVREILLRDVGEEYVKNDINLTPAEFVEEILMRLYKIVVDLPGSDSSNPAYDFLSLRGLRDTLDQYLIGYVIDPRVENLSWDIVNETLFERLVRYSRGSAFARSGEIVDLVEGMRYALNEAQSNSGKVGITNTKVNEIIQKIRR